MKPGDDMKKALEWLRTLLASGWPASDHANTLLAHIDAEPARAKRVFAEGMAAGRARFLVDLKALLEVK